MKDSTRQHSAPKSPPDGFFGQVTTEDTTLHYHFKVSSSFTKHRAEILILGTLPGEAFFDKKWPRRNITVEQVMVRGQMIYRCRVAKGNEIGHEWCAHDVSDYPRRIRHVATAGRAFYKQHSQAVHHSLMHPEQVRVFPDRIDLIMARLVTHTPQTDDKKSKRKFKRGDLVVVGGSPTVMKVCRVSGNQVTCQWNTPAGKPYERTYHQDVLEFAPSKKK